MIQKIGIENFRVFKEMTEFELRPLTLLTGPNNSGKSSFSKFLLLLKNGLGSLDFSKGEHHLEDFEHVLNWDNKDNEEITLRLNAPSILSPDFCMDFIYANKKTDWEKDCTIKVHNNENILFEIKKQTGSKPKNQYIPKQTFFDEDGNLNELGDEELTFDDTIYEFHINCNINLLIDLIYSKSIMVETSHINQNTSNLSSVKFEFPTETISGINFYNYFKTKGFSNHPMLFRNIALSNEIDNLDRNNLLYRIFIDGEPMESDTISKLQEEVFKNYVLKFDFGADYNFLSKQYHELINYCFSGNEYSGINNYAKRELQKLVKEIYVEGPDAEIKIEETKLGELLFHQKLFQYSFFDEGNDEFRATLFEAFAPEFPNMFKNIERISANRGSQKRVLQNKGENEMDEVVARWAALEKNNLRKELIQHIFSILEIDGELVVERYENTISVVYLKRGDKKINLVDLGFGYSQILVMVLKIMIVHYSDPGDFYFGRAVLIIEEPEANLHPNLQSKLAEIFALLASKFKYYSRPTFIIETHSEYFIRKLQYLVAKKEIETNIIETKAINKDSFLSGYSKEKLKISLSPQDVIIYYFNDDKYVSDNESKVKAIEITENGGLSKNFGKGFLDESAYLNLALYKLGKENRN